MEKSVMLQLKPPHLVARRRTLSSSRGCPTRTVNVRALGADQSGTFVPKVRHAARQVLLRDPIGYNRRDSHRTNTTTKLSVLSDARPLRTVDEEDYTGFVNPLVDLSEAPDNLLRRQAAESFERVDDVVMGGVSSSKVVPSTQR